MCKVLRKFEANAYEIELSKGVGISLIFNFANLYHYYERRNCEEDVDHDEQREEWVQQLLKKERELSLIVK